MAKGITKISFVDDLGSTPATVNRRTGELYISARKWKQMTPDQRLFMILHESGHVALNTTDELKADQYAFEQYIKTGRSLKSSVTALTDVLSGDHPEHITRALIQLERAKNIDQKNKKQGMKPSYNNTARTSQRANLFPNYGVPAAPDFVDFIGKKAAKRREKRQEAKQERKLIKAESKASKREAKAQKKINNSEANIILAQQGINGRAQLAGNILGGMAKVAGAVGGSIVGAKAVKALPSILNGGNNTGTGEALTSDPAAQIKEGLMSGNVPGILTGTVLPGIAGALTSKIQSIDPMEQSPDLQNAAYAENMRNNSRPNVSNTTNDDEDNQAKEKDKNNNLLIFGAIGAVILIGLIFFMTKKG